MRNFKMIGKMYREIAGLDKGILLWTSSVRF